MGLARGAVALLLQESNRRQFSGRIATLGVQTVYTSGRELSRQFKRFSVEPAAPLDSAAKQITDKTLFKLLGFDDLERLDYSDFEGAEHVVNLNETSLPAELHDKFDVVLDSGTLEHVFHVPNAIKNILSMVKVGGRVIFLSPSSNHMDHGFYMFSPTFFVDYFLANGFEINTCYVVRYSPDMDDLWHVYEYDTRRWRDLHIGGLDDKPYAIFVVATRRPDSTTDRIPQQGYYADTSPLYAGARIAADGIGADGGDFQNAAPRMVPPASSLRSNAKELLRHVPVAYRLAQRANRLIVRNFLNKKLVGRY